jgi:hypothetical protein
MAKAEVKGLENLLRWVAEAAGHQDGSGAHHLRVHVRMPTGSTVASTVTISGLESILPPVTLTLHGETMDGEPYQYPVCISPAKLRPIDTLGLVTLLFAWGFAGHLLPRNKPISVRTNFVRHRVALLNALNCGLFDFDHTTSAFLQAAKELDAWYFNDLKRALTDEPCDLPPNLLEVRRVAQDLGVVRKAVHAPEPPLHELMRRKLSCPPMSDEELLSEIFDMQTPSTVFVGRDGRLRTNVRAIAKRINDRMRASPEPLGSDYASRLREAIEAIADAETLACTEELLTLFADEGPDLAAAVSSLRGQGTEEECAQRHGVGLSTVQRAKRKIRAALRARGFAA